MGRKRKSSGAPLFLPAPNRRRGRIAENDMSIAGYVLKAARAARDGLPGRAVGPGHIIVGDRLQAEGERVRESPAIKPMKKLVQVGSVSELDKAAQAVPVATLVFDDAPIRPASRGPGFQSLGEIPLQIFCRRSGL